MSITTRRTKTSPDVTSPAVPTVARARSISRLPGKVLQLIARMSTSRANSVVGLTADAVVAIVLLGAGLRHHDVPATVALLTVVCGLVLFSLVEYGIHRWLFHGPSGIFEQGHRRHHEQPLGHDSMPFFLPPLAMFALAGLFGLIARPGFALLLAGSIAAGYATYGLSHAVIHHFRFQNALTRRWAAVHHIHHFHPDTNFGVTTPFWDMLLRTHYVSAAKRSKRQET